jgi:hypothetical protein
MKRLWTKYVDFVTTQFINHPYQRAALAVIFVLWAALYFNSHHADHVLGYFMIFAVIFIIYFLARAVDTLRVEDTVQQPDELVGMHINQK